MSTDNRISPSLRDILRAGTDQEHIRVDDLFSRLDLTGQKDYRHFLIAHYASFTALAFKVPTDDSFSDYLNTAISELAVDCRNCSVELAGIELPSIHNALHPLGIGYVVAGSHFGKKVLRKRWSCSDDPKVLSAGIYLTSETNKQMWSVFMDRVTERRSWAAQQDVIVKSARETFRVFEDSFSMAGELREQPAA